MGSRKNRDYLSLATEWTAPLLLSLQSFLGALQLLDALDVVYYAMIHKTTNVFQFDLGFSLVAPLTLLLAVWLGWMMWNLRFEAMLLPAAALFLYPLGLETCVSIASLMAAAGGLVYHRSLSKFLNLVFALLGGIEGLALIHWLFFVPLGWVSPLKAVAGLEMGLFYMTSHLAPFLVLLLMYTWMMTPFIPKLWKDRFDIRGSTSKERGEMPRRAKYLLILSVSLSVVAALYPYNSNVNPTGQLFGSDIRYYIETAEIVEDNLFQTLTENATTRPFIFIVIYGYQRLLGTDVTSAVKFLPVLLNPLLSTAMFFLALETFDDWWIASLASFFTACGIQVSVGMHAYFLTNMLGLCLSFFSLRSLFRALRTGKWISITIAGLFGGLQVFTHPWTFDQYVMPTVMMGGVMWYHARIKKYGYGRAKMVLYYLFLLGLAELFKSVFFGGYGGAQASETALQNLISLSDFWNANIFVFRILFGGLLSAVVLLSFTTLGVHLFGLTGIPNLYFFLFLMVTSLLFLMGNDTIKSRLLYNIPHGLFAAYGFFWFIKRKDLAFRNVFTTFCVLNVAVYLFRSLANLV
jgi:hypothetical protein